MRDTDCYSAASMTQATTIAFSEEIETLLLRTMAHRIASLGLV